MNKNELIEKAVVELNGVLPDVSNGCDGAGKYVVMKMPMSRNDESIGVFVNDKNDLIFIGSGEEFNDAADRVRGKPDWSLSPEWAKYLGQDLNGWHWFCHKPTAPNQRYFSSIGLSVKHCDGKIIGDWRSTLEKRPEQKALPSIADRYGVEIPWDGRNALPTDVDCNCEVEVTLALGGAKYTETGNANRFNWMLVKSYKVIDERYKPKPAPDKPWFEAGELPPVGTECLFYGDDDCFHKELKDSATVQIIAHFKIKETKVAAFTFFYGCQNNVQVEQAVACCFRPIKTDKEKAIEAAVKVISGEFEGLLAHVFNTPKDAAEKLYDAGLLRLPDQK